MKTKWRNSWDHVPTERPTERQSCPIVGSPPGGHIFKKIGSHRAHYIEYHKEYVPLYYCFSFKCSFRAFKYGPIRKNIAQKNGCEIQR